MSFGFFHARIHNTTEEISLKLEHFSQLVYQILCQLQLLNEPCYEMLKMVYYYISEMRMPIFFGLLEKENEPLSLSAQNAVLDVGLVFRLKLKLAFVD
ncbi:hypothetical protein Ciccas_010761 [Cichlidogyrus casuarinus]|uniref:Uncharacterized protein n=1 Tax=Cichlidogyrus casuarinus TaxID=1844966 RepID=A0ABD2PTL2_9PLAT